MTVNIGDTSSKPFLLRLPGELRTRIYTFAVEGHVIIIKNKIDPVQAFNPTPSTKVTFRFAIATVPVPTKTMSTEEASDGEDGWFSAD